MTGTDAVVQEDPGPWSTAAAYVGEFDTSYDTVGAFYRNEIETLPGTSMKADREAYQLGAAANGGPVNCVGRNMAGAIVARESYGHTVQPVLQYDVGLKVSSTGAVGPTESHFCFVDCDEEEVFGGDPDLERYDVPGTAGFLAAYQWEAAVDAASGLDHATLQDLKENIDSTVSSRYFKARVDTLECVDVTGLVSGDGDNLL